MTKKAKKQVPEIRNGMNIMELQEAVKNAPRKSMVASENEVLAEARKIQERKTKELNNRIRELLTKKVAPPNQFVAYLLGKLRDCRAEYEVLSMNIRNATQQLTTMKERLLALQGEHDKYLEDIQEWDHLLTKETKE